MAVAPNQKMASILGRVERERTRSTKESMARNKNMGWRRLHSISDEDDADDGNSNSSNTAAGC